MTVGSVSRSALPSDPLSRLLSANLDTSRVVGYVPGPGFEHLDTTFDILKLRKALDTVLADTDFIGDAVQAIFLTRIPGEDASVIGDSVRGQYWTRPDASYEEVERQKFLDERRYSEFVPEFADTYFKDVYDALSARYQLGRVRLLRLKPRMTLSFHREPEPRIHVPIVTNPGAIMVINNHATHLPADGSAYITDTRAYHNAFNGGEQDRIHLVASLPTGNEV